jgi:hypothetical protein
MYRGGDQPLIFVLHIHGDGQPCIPVLQIQDGGQPHILYIPFLLEKGEIHATFVLLLSRSRSKLEERHSAPAPGKFVDAEQMCLLNGAAAFLERKLFRQALENSDMVRSVISCVLPVIGIGLKYVGYYFSWHSVYFNSKFETHRS